MFVGTGNGYITTSVLKEILKELDDKMSPEDLDSIIEEIDSDGSGTVDFDGKDYYCYYMRRLPRFFLCEVFSNESKWG